VAENTCKHRGSRVGRALLLLLVYFYHDNSQLPALARTVIYLTKRVNTCSVLVSRLKISVHILATDNIVWRVRNRPRIYQHSGASTSMSLNLVLVLLRWVSMKLMSWRRLSSDFETNSSFDLCLYVICPETFAMCQVGNYAACQVR